MDKNEKLVFEAGQYLIVDCEGKGKRMYSIASLASETNSFTFIANYYEGGLASEYFMRLNKGDEVSFVGPIGKFLMKNTSTQKIFLVTGTGIAPAWSMIRSHLLVHPQSTIKLFWGMKSYSDVYLLDELKKLNAKYINFDFTLCLSQENNTTGKEHCVIGRFNDAIPTPAVDKSFYEQSEFYLCGGGKVVESTKIFLGERGVSKDRVFYERFD